MNNIINQEELLLSLYVLKDYIDNKSYFKRPKNPTIGQCYFDTKLNKPLWFNGYKWVDALGTEIETEEEKDDIDKPCRPHKPHHKPNNKPNRPNKPSKPNEDNNNDENIDKEEE